jgi:transcriptional regulator with XRE-family HTH domain
MKFGLKDLGENIKNIRISKKSRIKTGKPMLQYELAQLARIPASSLCNIEKGKYENPTWDILSKIAQGLDCDISDFFASENQRISPSRIALTEMIEMIVKERLEAILAEKVRK